jgi:hypothetical protein
MKVLARISALDAAAITIAGAAQAPAGERSESPGAAPGPQLAAVEMRPQVRVRRPRSRFPSVSVAALALLAAIAWSLASWSDAHRAERSRVERLARMQPVAAPETISR